MDEKTSKKIAQIKEKLSEIFERYPVERAGLFGSMVRGEDNENSDVDILVEIAKHDHFDLFDYIEIKQEIENKLSKKADLVEYNHLRERYRKFILPEEVRIYEKRQ